MRSSILFLALLLAVDSIAWAEEAKPEPPRVAVCRPLGVSLGTTTKVVVRGWKLEGATAVKCPTPGIEIRLLSSGAATPAGGQDAAKIGDQQLEIEIALPAQVDGPAQSSDSVQLVVVGRNGESLPHALLLGAPLPLVSESEPNDGFSSPQPVALPAAIDGDIQSDRDVDVYSFDGQAGQSIVAEILARRHGSALDSILTLYDDRRHILKTIDDVVDGAETADSRLEYELPAAGRYHLVVQDAFHKGGPAHPYRLLIHSKER